jgi:hypothetical protein
MTLTPQQLHILQHSLGLDQYGQGSFYRNRFVTGAGSTDWPICRSLVAIGLMDDMGPQTIAGGDHCFMVTNMGVQSVTHESPKPPKLSRSALRYREFLAADSGMTFKQWLTKNKKAE